MSSTEQFSFSFQTVQAFIISSWCVWCIVPMTPAWYTFCWWRPCSWQCPQGWWCCSFCCYFSCDCCRKIETTNQNIIIAEKHNFIHSHICSQFLYFSCQSPTIPCGIKAIFILARCGILTSRNMKILRCMPCTLSRHHQCLREICCLYLQIQDEVLKNGHPNGHFIFTLFLLSSPYLLLVHSLIFFSVILPLKYSSQRNLTFFT